MLVKEQKYPFIWTAGQGEMYLCFTTRFSLFQVQHQSDHMMNNKLVSMGKYVGQQGSFKYPPPPPDATGRSGDRPRTNARISPSAA